VSEIILEVPCVVETVFVVLLALSAFLVVLEGTTVDSSVAVLYDPLAVPLAVDELSVVVVLVSPVVVSRSIGEVLLKIACINLAVLEADGSGAPFHKVLELSLVAGLLFDENPEAFDGVVLPLADVAGSVGSFPDTAACFEVVLPFAIVGLSVLPLEFSSSFSFVVGKVPKIKGLIVIFLVSHSLFLIVSEMSFKYFTVMVEDDSDSLHLLAVWIDLPEIGAVGESASNEGGFVDFFEGIKMELVVAVKPLEGEVTLVGFLLFFADGHWQERRCGRKTFHALDFPD
jgi:hypothetical protein